MGFWDGSGISWTICKQSAPCSTQITTSLYVYRPDGLPDAQPTISKQQQQQQFNGRLSRTTRVGRYQKQHSPAHSFKVNSFKALKAILVTYVMFQ